MYEIKRNGKTLARSRFFGALKTECDRLADKEGIAAEIVEIHTIVTEQVIYKPLPRNAVHQPSP